MKFSKWKQVTFILSFSVLVALGMFLYETVFAKTEPMVSRNAYGEGKKTAVYELTVGDEEAQEIVLEVEEQEYTKEETRELFAEVMDALDDVILGENKSFDRIEYDMQLVSELEPYPVQIQWEFGSYEVINHDGTLREEKLKEEGTLVEIRGMISYKEEQALYARSGMVYPRTREGMDKLLHDIRKEISRIEAETRTDPEFVLPDEIAGVHLSWGIQQEHHWPYILFLGIVFSAFVIYREREKGKEQARLRRDELMRTYPGMISKFTMLLSTGATVKHAWEKIVDNYEAQKERVGVQIVYEEMGITLREIKGGISEGEAYERFGKRCGSTIYVKFGTMLSQNLRKGSKGIADALRMEAIQSFENRKSSAKRRGEEAGAKLLVPMIGMLAIVLIMVMVPAFLSLQI